MTPDETDEFAAGEVFAGFRILRRIGRGGMGSVYLAEDERLRRRIALKVIVPELARDKGFRRRFEAEARGAAAIQHPNVVPVLSAGVEDGHLYMAMQYIDGVNLDQALRSAGPLPPREAARILSSVAAGLDAAHAAGLVHRDVTPANILLRGELGRDGVYLTDFGLVRGVEGSETRLTNTGELIANLDYASPEQVKTGWIDARTDVYSLGCVLYRMLSGSRPFPGTDTQKMWKIVNDPVPPLPSGGELDAVIARATAKDPEERFPSAGDLSRAVGAVFGEGAPRSERSVASGLAATGYSESAEEDGATEPLPTEVFVTREQATRPLPDQRRPRRRLVIAAGVVVVVAVVAIAAVLVTSGGSKGGAGGSKASVTAGGKRERTPTQTQRNDALAHTLRAADRLQGEIYSVEPPAGWEQDPEVVEKPPYFPNEWRESKESDAAYVRAEGGVAVGEQDPVEAEEEVRRKTSKSPDYREIGFGAITLMGRSAVRWDYEVEGDRRVVYGFVECETGLGFVGSASPAAFASHENGFEAVADSLRANCAGNTEAPVVKTYGPAQIKPKTLYVSPTNGPYATDLTWPEWGSDRVVGAGTTYYDTCEPDCSQGYGHTAGKVILSEPRDCEGQMQYTIVRLIYEGLPEHDFWGEYGCAGTAPRIHIGA